MASPLAVRDIACLILILKAHPSAGRVGDNSPSSCTTCIQSCGLKSDVMLVVVTERRLLGSCVCPWGTLN